MSDDLEAAIEAQLEELRDQGALEVRPEPRCRVCRNDEIRTTVNKLLAHGMTLRDIHDIIQPIARRGRERINISNLREHRRRHFNVQSSANSVYRAIVERRARELNLDYEEGIGTAVTHLAYLDTMIAKGYQTLISDDTVVTYRDGLDAAMKRNELNRLDAGAAEQARIMAEMDRVIAVVKEVCTPEQLAIMGARLNGGDSAPVPVVSRRPMPEEDDYDPDEDHDEYDD